MKPHEGKKIVCIDLDGVLNLYNGWVADDHFPDIRPGALEFIREVDKHFRVFILTARTNHTGVWEWLKQNKLASYIEEVTNTKVGAHFYLDDRGVMFTGDFDKALRIILNFKPFWKEE